MPKSIVTSILTMCFVGFSTLVASAETQFETGGSARIRGEIHNQSDFNKDTPDYQDFIGSRFRLNLRFKTDQNFAVFVQPQFTKIWGQPELNLTSASTPPTASSDATSGSTNDTPLDVHQAFVDYSWTESLALVLGRKELSFGDELLVGSLGWSNVGRSFDLALVKWQHEFFKANIFSASVAETNASAAGAGDAQFHGAYFTLPESERIKAADLYAFYLSDPTQTTTREVTTFGGRIKALAGPIDLRAEATHQKLTKNAHQVDVEAGYSLSSTARPVRFAVEYFQASAHFDQLYPTAHKWLGIADLLGRRNIQGYRIGASSTLIENLTVKIDYHLFLRDDTQTPAYKLNGTTSYGTTGTDENIGNEWDLVMTYKLNPAVTVELGAAWFTPGEYLKDNLGDDRGEFYYLQAMTEF